MVTRSRFCMEAAQREFAYGALTVPKRNKRPTSEQSSLPPNPHSIESSPFEFMTLTATVGRWLKSFCPMAGTSTTRSSRPGSHGGTCDTHATAASLNRWNRKQEPPSVVCGLTRILYPWEFRQRRSGAATGPQNDPVATPDAPEHMWWCYRIPGRMRST